MVSETRKIDDFNSISTKSIFNIVLTKGKVGTLTVKAEENIMAYITTQVKDKELIIKFKDNKSINVKKAISINVPFNILKHISLRSTGDIEINKEITNPIDFYLSGTGNISAIVKTSHIKASVSGTGDIKLSGKTDNFNCSVSGTGNINAYALKAKNTNANITGTGNIYTYASSELKTNLSGLGSIYYKGSPSIINTYSSDYLPGRVLNKN
ncbi:MAG: head GIN domain-containing protein [Tenacibaculum sp.]